MWKAELRSGTFWRVTDGKGRSWGDNKHQASEEKAEAIAEALNRLEDNDQPKDAS